MAGACLALLFVAMFVANIHASRTGAGLGGEPPTPMLLRAPMQVLFIAIALWSTRTRRSNENADQRAA